MFCIGVIMVETLSPSNLKPKVICVCFNPLINPNEYQDNDDVDSIWANPPPAHALDVAELLSQLDIDVILTGFIPKDCNDKLAENFVQQKFSTHFIEIDNFANTKKKSNVSYSTNPLTVTDSEKEQFINFMIQVLEQQTHSVLFTGDLPHNFTLQDFKTLIQRLRKRNSELFIEMNNKVVGIVGTCIAFTYQPLDKYHHYRNIAWLKESKLEIFLDNRISNSCQRFELTFTSFERRNPRHVRSAIFSNLIFRTATAVMHSNSFHKKIQVGYTKILQTMNKTDCEYQKNEAIDIQTMQLLNIKNNEEIVSDEEILESLATQIIHAVSQDSLILPTKLDMNIYQDYFSIKNLDRC